MAGFGANVGDEIRRTSLTSINTSGEPVKPAYGTGRR